jgi:predicted Fe-S protein YdhL (DUF1289 family)
VGGFACSVALAAWGGTGDAATDLSLTPIQQFMRTYSRTLEVESCLRTAPDKEDLGLMNEEERYAVLRLLAERKGMAAHMKAVETEWRELDLRSDKVCHHQVPKSPSSRQILHDANDEMLLRIAEL